MSLILTIRLDASTQRWLDDLRRMHYPLARNHRSAHLTIFQALPTSLLETARCDVAEAALRPRIALSIVGMRWLGRGLAYVMESEELSQLRQNLADRWAPHLTPEDRRPFTPQVTVQDKVALSTAATLLSQLSDRFEPRSTSGVGLDLWRLCGGALESVVAATFDADHPAGVYGP